MGKLNSKGSYMTTVVGMICKDGLVMGSDMKVVGANVKWADTKLEVVQVGDSPLIIGGSGIIGTTGTTDTIITDSPINNF